MAAFVSSTVSPFIKSERALASASKCSLNKKAVSPMHGPIMYDMNGNGINPSLGEATYKSSGVNNDRRCFKVTYCLPSESRAYSSRELQNIYQTKLIPFSSWYAEQQRIMKMGGTIFKVELAVGSKQKNVGNT